MTARSVLRSSPAKCCKNVTWSRRLLPSTRNARRADHWTMARLTIFEQHQTSVQHSPLQWQRPRSLITKWGEAAPWAQWRSSQWGCPSKGRDQRRHTSRWKQLSTTRLNQREITLIDSIRLWKNNSVSWFSTSSHDHPTSRASPQDVISGKFNKK